MALRLLSFVWIIAWALFPMPAVAQQGLPPQDPILRIDPGMHTGLISRIGVDAACTLLATGSEDKTVRLWRLPDGELLRTLRPPIGPGGYGKLLSVTMSPDGTWVAAGGWDAARMAGGGDFIYIFSTATGAVAARLGPLTQGIFHLAVSPDGRYLAATLEGGEGLRVWERTGADFANWRLVAEDKDYEGAGSFGATFDRAGVLFTVAFDGKLRRYAPGYTGKPISVVTKGGKGPYSVAVNPQADRVAVGYLDTGAVDVYNAATLALRYAADTKRVGTNGVLQAVAWSADGGRLYAGGSYPEDKRSSIVVWNWAGKGWIREIEGPLTRIFHLLPCGDGIAMAAGDPAFGLISGTGRRKLWRENVQADLRSTIFDAVAVSDNGARLRFNLARSKFSVGTDPVLFDLATERLSEAPEAPSDLHGPDAKSLPIVIERDGVVKLDGKEFEPNLRARRVAIAPDQKRFVLSAEWSLIAYDKDGKRLWHTEGLDVAWSVNVTRDGRLVVAAYDDGTIRWHRIEDGKELLAFAVHAKDRRWVAWTPKGYFTASAGGEELVGWHVNRGWDKAADFFPVSKFRDQFYRPDIVARVLKDLGEEKAIAEANKTSRKARQDEDIRKLQPPVLRIVSPADGSTAAGDEVKIEYSLRSPSGLPVKRVFAQVDGNLVEGQVSAVPAVSAAGDVKGVLTLKLPPRDVTVTVTAETDRAFDAAVVRLLKPKAKTEAPIAVSPGPTLALPSTRPNLYAVVIGVGRYTKARPLPFADDDAVAVTETLEKLKGSTYADVKIKLLTTREKRGTAHEEVESTNANIKKSLNWLRAQRRDVDGIVLVYFSGHGQTMVDQSSFLLPVDFDPNDYVDTALSKAHLLDVLTRRGKVLLFVDACHAAGGLADIQAVPLDARDFVNAATAISGSWVFAFASSLGTQPSFGTLQSKSFFTRAVIQGLSGKAAAPGEKVILTGDLDVWLHRQVEKQSGGEQVAIMFKSPGAHHVPLAILP